jgi:IS605 OrfB family transposase
MIITNKLFTTISIKLDNFVEFKETMKIYNQICQEIIDFGWEEGSYNKTTLHNGTYKKLRLKYPKFSSAMVQTARDNAGEILKRTMKKNKDIEYKNIKRKHSIKLLDKPIKQELSSIRYDRRSLTIRFDKNIISINTIFGRMKIPFKMATYYNKYLDWKYSNAQLIQRKNGDYYINLQMNKDIPKKSNECKVLGIDLGIKKIAVTSDNKFYKSSHLKNIKGKYQKLKRDLQSKGTKSAKRKLSFLSRKENRFVRDVNHCVSKEIVNTEYNVFVLENLKNIRFNTRTYNKKLNRMIGNWSFAQLQNFIEYKSERLGKSVVYIKPNYTSQQCSKCSYTEKDNRNGNIFLCKKCGYELDADLNASRNIARIGRTDFLQGLVNSPKVGIVENKGVEICS